MKRIFAIFTILFLSSCDELIDVEEFTGTCTIILVDGSTITTDGIEFTKSTEVITYRDEDGKLWSLFPGDYDSYSCN